MEDEEDNIDVRVYQYLDLLHHRGWGSPLLSSEHESNNNEESYGGREYDSPFSSRVVLDLLGSSGKTAQGSGAGRCMVEYALRGVNRSNKRSDASKIVRGLEGLKKVEESEVHDKRMRRLACTPVSEVLRIKPRTVSRKTEGEDDKVGGMCPRVDVYQQKRQS